MRETEPFSVFILLLTEPGGENTHTSRLLIFQETTSCLSSRCVADCNPVIHALEGRPHHLRLVLAQVLPLEQDCLVQQVEHLTLELGRWFVFHHGLEHRGVGDLLEQGSGSCFGRLEMAAQGHDLFSSPTMSFTQNLAKIGQPDICFCLPLRPVSQTREGQI